MEEDFLFEVIHDKKGDGKVIAFVFLDGERYVKIDFGETVEDFIYPDQFMCHLKAKDLKIQKKIEDEYAAIHNPSRPKYYLSALFLAGTNAQCIYDKYCKIFGWEPMYRGRFSHKQKLYAAKATLEGFAVWMPVHTNLCEEYNKNHSWYNFIIGDEIKEVWFIEDYELLSDDSTRVCFAKNTEGYVFQGVYAPVRTQKEEIKGKLELVRTFKRISTIYPIEKQKNEATVLKVAPEKTTEYIETSLVLKKCQIEAYNIDKDKPITVCVEELFPIYQEKLVGKRKGETYSLNGQTYRIDKILIKKE